MKRIIVTLGLLVFGLSGFCQEQENGTIYIKHPYIDVVLNSVKAYQAGDNTANEQIFSDTAKFWASGMAKPIAIADAFKMWDKDFNNYNDLKITQVGYPDYLHYIDHDSKYVQSWWRWSGKSKKTGAMLTIDLVQFDEFNNDGKIVNEGIYGDFSKLEQ